ncbi:MAG: mechanosensitive ion channel [Actinobacteria bacterium]|nr:mechanosensitive ion channel [Actinomycetota bacterium]
MVAYRAIDIGVAVLARRASETETMLDDSLVPLLRTSMRLFVTAVGILFVLQNLDVNVSSLVAGLGLGGLAIALAAQDTVRNVLGGATIFADKPFEVGDWVVVDGVEGTVETVGFRSTRVRTFYNSLVSVPNGNLMNAGIDNMGQRRWRRYKTTLGVGYHTTPDQMQAFVEGIRAIIQASPGMRQDYYIVEFHGFGSTSLDVLVYCFMDAADWNEELRTRHVLNLDIMRLAEALQVDFAFPTQTVHIAEMPGQSQKLPDVPDRAGLREIVNSFGPGGKRGQRIDQPITTGHESVLESPYAQADEGS